MPQQALFLLRKEFRAGGNFLPLDAVEVRFAATFAGIPLGTKEPDFFFFLGVDNFPDDPIASVVKLLLDSGYPVPVPPDVPAPLPTVPGDARMFGMNGGNASVAAATGWLGGRFPGLVAPLNTYVTLSNPQTIMADVPIVQWSDMKAPGLVWNKSTTAVATGSDLGDP